MSKDDNRADAHGTPQISNYAQHVIAELGLTPHPEHDAQCVTLCVDKHDACGEPVVPEGVWQRTISSDEDALVSCMVSPGFTFASFKLASRD